MDKNFFSKILADHQNYVKLREKVINLSRKVLKLSKQSIFMLHRDDIEEAKKLQDDAEKILKEINSFFAREKKLEFEGSYRECSEEFIEANLFYGFIKNNEVGLDTKIKFSFDDYLGGVSDLTGELLRKAIQLATRGEYKQLETYHQAMENILGELIKHDFTGKLRMKYDAAKRNLKRMEEVMYEIKIKGLK